MRCRPFHVFSSLCLAIDLIKEVLSMDDEIQKLATELYHQKSVLIMGRGYHYAACLEGALVSGLLFSDLVERGASCVGATVLWVRL